MHPLSHRWYVLILYENYIPPYYCLIKTISHQPIQCYVNLKLLSFLFQEPFTHIVLLESHPEVITLINKTYTINEVVIRGKEIPSNWKFVKEFRLNNLEWKVCKPADSLIMEDTSGCDPRVQQILNSAAVVGTDITSPSRDHSVAIVHQSLTAMSTFSNKSPEELFSNVVDSILLATEVTEQTLSLLTELILKRLAQNTLISQESFHRKNTVC